MQSAIYRRLLLAMAGILLAAGPVRSADEAQTRQVVDDLRKGGFVIYFRHGETGASGSDVDRAVFSDCSTQRNLSEAGRVQVRQFGEDFRALGIPVGKALSSEFCRCWQHAEAMFGKGGYQITDKLSVARSYPAVSEADRKLNNDNLRAMLSATPAAGTNTVLVSHGNNVLLLTGYHPDVQGEAIIFRPDGAGGFTRIANLFPGDWTRARK